MAGRIGSVYFLDKPLDSELPNRDGFFLPPGLYFTGQGCHFRFFYASGLVPPLAYGLMPLDFR